MMCSVKSAHIDVAAVIR